MQTTSRYWLPVVDLLLASSPPIWYFLGHGSSENIPSNGAAHIQSTATPQALPRQIENVSSSHARGKSSISLRPLGSVHGAAPSRAKPSVMEQRFVPALGRLRKFLEEASVTLQIPIDFALIGGLAVSTWGAVRATQDVDLLANSDPSPIGDPRVRDGLRKFLQKKRCTVDWRVGDSDDPIPLLLRIEFPKSIGRLGTDILWAHKRWHQEALQRRLEVKSGRLRMYVLHPEDLILLKLDAGGPQDLLDVRALLAAKPSELDIERLKRGAAQLRLQTLLDSCLSDRPKRNHSR